MKVGSGEGAFFEQNAEGATPGALRTILARVPDHATDRGDPLLGGWQQEISPGAG